MNGSRGICPAAPAQRATTVSEAESQTARGPASPRHTLECEGRELCVRDDVAGDRVPCDDLAENTHVLGAGARNPGDGRGEPVGDALPGHGGFERSLKASLGCVEMRRNAARLGPRKSDAASAVELFGEQLAAAS